MARRSSEPEKAPNHERWLITYADLITLLMIFFVLMYTISNVNSKKFAQLAGSMSQALIGQNSGHIVGESPGPLIINTNPNSAAGRAELANMKEAQEQIEKYVKEKGLEGKVEVSQEERGLIISLKEALLFDLGSADITAHSKDVIVSVGEILTKLPNQIRIEGHTDTLPISTARFPSNWELSTTRATTVVKFLVHNVGIRSEKISATGYGEFRPIVPNTSRPNMARNRRVDIVVMRSMFDAAEPGQTEKKPENNVAFPEPQNANESDGTAKTGTDDSAEDENENSQ